MTLAEKLHAIQKLARKVPKRGKHERGWAYMRIEEVIGIATRFMTEHKLIITPNVKSLTRSERGGGSVVDLMVTWTLTDSTDTRIEGFRVDADLKFDVCGSGFDYDSKGTAKALTDSRKSAMILIFNLKGGEDPERAPITRGEAKDRQQEIADAKLANAAAGKGIDADTPQLFYTPFEESSTVLITGDKELMKAQGALLKEFKLGGKVILPEAKFEALRVKLEEKGIPLTKLVT
jgi:hypothetical protein